MSLFRQFLMSKGKWIPSATSRIRSLVREMGESPRSTTVDPLPPLMVEKYKMPIA